MKIAVFHELPLGGALRSFNALAQELSRHHEVTIYSVAEASTPNENAAEAHSFVFHPTKQRGFVGRITHDTVDLLRLARLHLSIAREIDAGKYDVVVVHPSRWTQAPFLLSFLRTPTVYYCQEPLRLVHDPCVYAVDGLALPNKLYEKLNRAWRGWIDFVNTQAAGSLLANSHFSCSWIERVYGRKADVCYLGVDTQLFRPIKTAKKYDILFLGAPVSIEGFDLLKKAQAISHRIWSVCVVKRRVNGRGISDAQLVKTINQSRVVVCLSKNEPFGLTILEAGGCGVPVVAVHEGGFVESVKDKQTGLLVTRDPEGLAHALNHVLADSGLRREMGREGRDNALRHWTWEKSGRRLEQLLTRAVRNSERNIL